MNASSGPEIETGSFARAPLFLWPPGSIRVVDWNINRGLRLDGILKFLSAARADLILLQECDLNARRTHRVNIAQEIARSLQMNYAFGREFHELSQGSKDSPAYHGQATLSRWPISKVRILRFTKQSGFWRPRWFLPDIEPLQERTGGRMALVAEVNVGGRSLATYNLHLESRGDDSLRCDQLKECMIDAIRYAPSMPIIVAGDFNLDITRTAAGRVIAEAQFSSASPRPPARTTPGSFFDPGRSIDWVFIRGPVRSDGFSVHTSISASDHYPLSSELVFG